MGMDFLKHRFAVWHVSHGTRYKTSTLWNIHDTCHTHFFAQTMLRAKHGANITSGNKRDHLLEFRDTAVVLATTLRIEQRCRNGAAIFMPNCLSRQAASKAEFPSGGQGKSRKMQCHCRSEANTWRWPNSSSHASTRQTLKWQWRLDSII